MAEGDDDIPEITLGRKQWPVQEFVWRDIKKLAPMLRKASRINWQELSEADMDLLADIMFLAIGRGTEIRRDDVDAMPMTLAEIVAAIPVIAGQAGRKSGDQPAGEAVAAGSQPGPT